MPRPQKSKRQRRHAKQARALPRRWHRHMGQPRGVPDAPQHRRRKEDKPKKKRKGIRKNELGLSFAEYCEKYHGFVEGVPRDVRVEWWSTHLDLEALTEIFINGNGNILI